MIPFIQQNLFPLSYLEFVAFLESLISDLRAPARSHVDDTELLKEEGARGKGRGREPGLWTSFHLI